MKLGIGAVPFGPKVAINLDLIRRAEELGFDSAWTAEAYGNDAVSTASWVLAKTTRIKVGTAIMQMPARTPAMAAMTAMTLDQLSGGRFILGLGTVGSAGRRGLARRSVRQASDAHAGVHPDHPPDLRARGAARRSTVRDTRFPATGPGTTGLGKPLKSILHGRPDPDLHRRDLAEGRRAARPRSPTAVFPMLAGPARVRRRRADSTTGLPSAGDGKSLADFDVAPASA